MEGWQAVITFDMAQTTNEALELVAQAQGKTLDEILRGVITKNLKLAAKLNVVKANHEAQVRRDNRATQLDVLLAEQKRLQRQIAKWEK